MKGHVRKRGAGWAFVVDVSAAADGKRRQRWRSGFRTRNEAERPLAETIGQVHRGELLDDRPRPRRPAHRRRAAAGARAGAAEPALTPSCSTAAAATASRCRRAACLVHATIRKALADAVRWGRLARNVAELADPPSAGAEQAARSAAMHTWTAEQLRAFLEQVADDRLAAAWHLAPTTCLRRAELAGLRWADVDLEAGRIAVRRGLVSVDVAVTESETS